MTTCLVYTHQPSSGQWTLVSITQDGKKALQAFGNAAGPFLRKCYTDHKARQLKIIALDMDQDDFDFLEAQQANPQAQQIVESMLQEANSSAKKALLELDHTAINTHLPINLLTALGLDVNKQNLAKALEKIKTDSTMFEAALEQMLKVFK